MKLDLFKYLNQVREKDIHPKFKFLLDNPALGAERQVLIDWTDGFVDRDNKIIMEFQTTFHSSLWEFYLFRVFKEAGFQIDFSHDRPDFIIESPVQINVEAVVSNIRLGGDGEEKRNMSNILSMVVPPHLQGNFNDFLNEAVVRYSNAITGKNINYLSGYSHCSWVQPQTPFVIALSSYSQIDYGREYYYPLLALLYGLKYDPTEKKLDPITEVNKPNTATTIPVGLFNDGSFEHISAIIFSCTTTLGKLTSLSNSKKAYGEALNNVITIRQDYEEPIYKVQFVSSATPEELSDGLFIFHNPFAKHKIPKEIFRKTNMFQITFENRKLEFEGENLPIVSRLNIPNYLMNDLILQDIYHTWNSK